MPTYQYITQTSSLKNIDNICKQISVTTVAQFPCKCLEAEMRYSAVAHSVNVELHRHQSHRDDMLSPLLGTNIFKIQYPALCQRSRLRHYDAYNLRAIVKGLRYTGLKENEKTIQTSIFKNNKKPCSFSCLLSTQSYQPCSHIRFPAQSPAESA